MKVLAIIMSVVCMASCSQPPSQPVPNRYDWLLLGDDFLQSQGQKASPNYIIQLPLDHGAHYDFDIEWWYVTSNLQDELGQEYAVQWTLFRLRNSSADNHIYVGHMSLHTQDAHWFVEKYADSRLGTAGVTESPRRLFIDNWQWLGEQEQALFPAVLTSSWVTVDGQQVAVDLKLTTSGPFVFHGENGYSRKTANQSHASHYYSQPFIDVQGQITVDSNAHTVAGKGWYDHEWSSTLSSPDTVGWDWFSIHLDNGNKLMLFRMRVDGEFYETGSFISSSGQVSTLTPQDIVLRLQESTDVENKKIPTQWRITLAGYDVDIVVTALKPDAINKGSVEYYEGPTIITGSHTGKGFLEMTSY